MRVSAHVDTRAKSGRIIRSGRQRCVQTQHQWADIQDVLATTVVIAEPDQLAALRERSEYADALAFTDAQTPAALEAILINRPNIVVVERIFASKSRGAALINRIKADPSLEQCEIRIVAQDSGVTRVAPRQTTTASTSGGTTTITAVVTSPAVLDQKGTRRAARHRIIGGIEVLIDGNPALLVDMSVVGAQVVSTTLLKPNQRVRLSFVESSKPVRFSAGVAWSSFELPKGTPRYRAGIEFADADARAVEAYCLKNKVN